MKPSAEQFPGNPNYGGKGLVQWDDRNIIFIIMLKTEVHLGLI